MEQLASGGAAIVIPNVFKGKLRDLNFDCETI